MGPFMQVPRAQAHAFATGAMKMITGMPGACVWGGEGGGAGGAGVLPGGANTQLNAP